MTAHKRKYVIAITIVMVVVSLFFAAPLWYVLGNAFKRTNAIFKNPLLLTVDNFYTGNLVKAFKLLRYPDSFLNSMIVLVLSLFFTILAGSMAAYALMNNRSRLFKGIQTSIILMITLPLQLAMVPLVRVAASLGLTGTYFGVAIILAAVGLPFTIFLYCNGIRSIPKELHEAAVVDGCGYGKMYLLVYMPLLKNTTATIIILRGVAIWNEFLINQLMTTSPQKMTLPTMLYSTINPRLTDWGVLFAGTLLVSLPMVIIFLLLQKAFIRGFVSGSIKG